MDKQTYIGRIQHWYDEPKWKAHAGAWISGAAFAEKNDSMKGFLRECGDQLREMSFQEFHQWLTQEASN